MKEIKNLDGMKMEFRFDPQCGYTLLINGEVFGECIEEWELRHATFMEVLDAYNELNDDNLN